MRAPRTIETLSMGSMVTLRSHLSNLEIGSDHECQLGIS